jgi:hypothetical protein
MDGSHHDWLEGRGPKLVLMAYIDDATGNVFARFYGYEGTRPAMRSFLGYIRQYGIPQSVYLDKHTTYKSNAKPTVEDDLAGRKPQSQFERALGELEVEVIHAHSPQAKGRIERLFETFQDRLVKELRLEQAKTREEANGVLKKYLSEYNRRFGREASNPADLHRPAPKDTRLDRIFSIRAWAAFRNDNTVHHHNRIYLIPKRFIKKRPFRVLVEERLDGKVYLMDGEERLEYREVREAPKIVSSEVIIPARPRKASIPARDHPWHKVIRRSIRQHLQQKELASAGPG